MTSTGNLLLIAKFKGIRLKSVFLVASFERLGVDARADVDWPPSAGHLAGLAVVRWFASLLPALANW